MALRALRGAMSAQAALERNASARFW